MSSDQSNYAPFRFIDDEGLIGLELAADAGIGWEVFEELGHLGNGHDWTRVIRKLLADKAKPILDDLEFSSEADFFVVYSRNQSALTTIVELVAEFFDDRAKLKSVIETYGGY